MVDQVTWFKSSHSDFEEANCVEVALAASVHIRDSKAVPTGPEVRVSGDAWGAFLAGARAGNRL